MKKLVFLLSFLVGLSVLAGTPSAPNEDLLYDGAVTILPSRLLTTAPLWHTNWTIGQGRYMRWGNQIYMTDVAGTTDHVASPTHMFGDATNGTVMLRAVTRGYRGGFVVINNSTNQWIYLSLGSPAIRGAGIALAPNGGSFGYSGEAFQSHVSAICEASNAPGVLVTSQEF